MRWPHVPRWLPVTATLLISVAVSCSAAALAQPLNYEEWQSAISSRGVGVDEAVYPFAVTPEMKAWASEFYSRYVFLVPQDRLKRLQEALFSPERFPFSYDERLTLTAAQAFAERRGNCMAFTALFIALSRAMGDETFLVSVRKAPEVERSESLVVVNRHVVAGYSRAGQMYLYDFYITTDMPYIQRRVIDDLRATAMYHTNLGGAAIRDGKLQDAVHHLELAVRIDPALAAAWVNLGVVRFRNGDIPGAMTAYEKALEADPENSSAFTNMAYVYRHLGQEEQARMALLAAAQERSTPFALIALADLELAQGNTVDARHHLLRARRAFPREPEVYVALARLASKDGDLSAAARYQRRAHKLVSSARD